MLSPNRRLERFASKRIRVLLKCLLCRVVLPPVRVLDTSRGAEEPEPPFDI